MEWRRDGRQILDEQDSGLTTRFYFASGGFRTIRGRFKVFEFTFVLFFFTFLGFTRIKSVCPVGEARNFHARFNVGYSDERFRL